MFPVSSAALINIYPQEMLMQYTHNTNVVNILILTLEAEIRILLSTKSIIWLQWY